METNIKEWMFIYVASVNWLSCFDALPWVFGTSKGTMCGKCPADVFLCTVHCPQSNSKSEPVPCHWLQCNFQTRPDKMVSEMDYLCYIMCTILLLSSPSSAHSLKRLIIASQISIKLYIMYTWTCSDTARVSSRGGGAEGKLSPHPPELSVPMLFAWTVRRKCFKTGRPLTIYTLYLL